MTQERRDVVIASWKQLREEIRNVNQELSNIIDELDPDNSYKLIKASYLYGDMVVKDGFVHIPTSNNQLEPINSEQQDNSIRQELGYHAMPPFLVLDKCNEIFINAGNRIIPINLFSKGWLTGVYEFMDIITQQSFKYNWNFSAGSRSIFMLPKVYDSIGLNKLYSEYNIAPHSLSTKNSTDHWLLFKEIAQSNNFDQNWKNQIIYFGHKWFQKKNDSVAWQKFRDYFIKQGWLQAQYSIAKINFALEWGKYAEIISSRRPHPKLYIVDHLRHILSIANGYYPAFKPADNSQEIAPTTGIKKAFTDIYELKDYIPTIMHTSSVTHFTHDQPVYYSLSFPTLVEGSPLKKGSSTILVDIKQLKLLIETVRNYLICNNNSSRIIQDTNFEYFHIEKDNQEEIKPSSEILAGDPYFLKDELVTKNRIFCTTSPFFRGCIRINPIHTEQKQA